MNEVMIMHMSKSEIESSYHLFDEKQMLAAVKRLLELGES